jgi:hypothetical protein
MYQFKEGGCTLNLIKILIFKTKVLFLKRQLMTFKHYWKTTHLQLNFQLQFMVENDKPNQKMIFATKT